jgi:nitrogenase subunit NifH
MDKSKSGRTHVTNKATVMEGWGILHGDIIASSSQGNGCVVTGGGPGGGGGGGGVVVSVDLFGDDAAAVAPSFETLDEASVVMFKVNQRYYEQVEVKDTLFFFSHVTYLYFYVWSTEA